jgi:hypothetical protein
MGATPPQHRAGTGEETWTGPPPDSPAHRLFRDIIATVAAHARDAFPDALDRIAQARDLVLAGAVVQHADGSFTVTHP